MCQSGECERCRLAAKEAQMHDAFVRDVLIDTRRPKEKPTRWRKFQNDVEIGNGGDQADSLDTSFLANIPKQN